MCIHDEAPSTSQESTTTSTFLVDVKDGARDALPILFALVPFSAVFGAVAMERGLSLGELLFASMSIFAVASQYVMMDLFGQKVPVWSIVLAVLAVNFRHVLYSAAIGRHMRGFSGPQKVLAFFFLSDPQYAASENRAAGPGLRPAYYFAYAATVYLTWISANVIGALFGSLIENPAAFGFDFILPLYFTGLVVGFHTRSGFLPVLVASASLSLAVYFTLGSPWHITLGGLGGLAIAAALSTPRKAAIDA